ncbi:MAG: hypothetical protein JW928_03065 [Candidatus Aureabacteria bacterium]|nr:hypothetical protein [Candidatus Auribacterota bacterium]
MFERFFKCVAVISVFLLMSGCIDSNTVIKIKPDGSGTIEETVLMSKEMVAQMTMMTQQMQQQMQQSGMETGEGADPSEEAFNMFDENKLKEKASQIGEGVTYVSGEEFETETQKGYKAVFAFEDINKIKINQNPGESVPQGPGGSGKKEEYVTFQFTEGKPSSLIITQPVVQPEAEDFGGPEEAEEMEEIDKSDEDMEASDMMENPMAQMFKGMRMAIAIEVDGDIIETNATHREGNIITLMEMDFGKILENPEKFKEFSKVNPKSVEESKELMKDIPGIKVELNESVEIKFE